VTAFGIFDHMDDAGGPLAAQYEDRLAFVEACDRAGFRCYHLAEHHGTPLGNAPSPSVFLAAAIQRTKRLRLGAMVYVLPLYHPLRVAEEICMLDHMSGGRLDIGFGRGAVAAEISLYGVDAGEAQALYREGYDIVTQALAAEEVRYDGAHYRIDGFPMHLKPLQRPHPPIWYGTVKPESIPWVAERGLNVMGLGSAEVGARLAAAYRTEWARLGRAAGAMPLIGLNRHVVVADSDDEAMAIGRRAYAPWRAALEYLWLRSNVPLAIAGAFPPTFDELVAIGNGIAGAPDTVREAVRNLVAAGELTYLACHLAFGDMTRAEMCRSAELFGSHVIGQA